jgi:hypothetical protein
VGVLDAQDTRALAHSRGTVHMCFNAPISFGAWVVITALAILAWWRNEHPYDPAVAGLLLTLGLVQLAEFLHYVQTPRLNVGRLIYILLWMQVAVWGLGVFVTLNVDVGRDHWLTILSGLWGCFMLLACVAAMAYSRAATFTVSKGQPADDTGSSHLQWKRDGGPILGQSSGVLYLLGLLLPLLALLIEYNTIGLWVMLVYGIAAFIVTRYLFKDSVMPSLWCFSVIGLAALVVAFQHF